MKKCIALLLSLCMAFTLAAPAFADESVKLSGNCGQNGDILTYTLELSNGDTDHPTYKLTISGSGAMEDYNQTSAPWLYNSRADSITKIVIKDGVTSIGDYAFESCSNLKTVTLPASLTKIGKGAFFGCGALTEVELPDKVSSLGEDAFFGCGKLEYFCMPSDLEPENIGKDVLDGTAVTTVWVRVSALTDSVNVAALQAKLTSDELIAQERLVSVLVEATAFGDGHTHDYPDVPAAADNADSTALLLAGSAVAAVGVAAATYFYTHPEIYEQAVQAVQDACNSAVNAVNDTVASIQSALGLNQSEAAPAEADATLAA